MKRVMKGTIKLLNVVYVVDLLSKLVAKQFPIPCTIVQINTQSIMSATKGCGLSGVFYSVMFLLYSSLLFVILLYMYLYYLYFKM